MKLNYSSITQFKQFVELKDYRPATKKEYVRYVCKLAEHFQCDPASLNENQIRGYFLFLRQHKRYKAAPMKAAKFSLRAFFLDCLKVQGWSVFQEVRIAEAQVLPIVLSRDEVRAVLAAVREPRFAACLRLMYHCGLRVGEAVAIQCRDLHHSRTDRPQLHVRNGKGGKDRRVPMTPAMVKELRQWWSTHRNKQFLFPSALCLSFLQPSRLSSVRAWRCFPMAGTPAPPSSAGALLLGYLHRSRRTARSDPLQPENLLRSPSARERPRPA